MTLHNPETLIKLEEHCKEFIKNQNITAPEIIYQSDRVIENAYAFIEGICDIVGYVEVVDEQET